MMQEIKGLIRQAMLAAYGNSIDTIKIAHALSRLFQGSKTAPARSKKAYAARDLDRIFAQELRKHRVEMAYPLDLGKYFLYSVNKAAGKFGLDRDEREDVVSQILANWIMGKNLEIGNSWNRNFAEDIQHFNDMVDTGTLTGGQKGYAALVGKRIWHIAVDVLKRYRRQRQNEETLLMQDEEGASGKSLERMDAEGLLNRAKHDPDLRMDLQRVHQSLQKADPLLFLPWMSLLQNPEMAMRELVREGEVQMPGMSQPRPISDVASEINGKFDENGALIPVQERFLIYQRSKLQDFLKSRFPSIAAAF